MRPSNNAKAPTVTDVTSKSTFDALRRMMRAALESGRTDTIALDRKVVWAFPPAGKRTFRPRSPYNDETARALALPAVAGTATQDPHPVRGAIRVHARPRGTQHDGAVPRGYKNPSGTFAISSPWFNGHFRRWIAALNLAPAVPHQARHTLATRLLAAGASLQHIKRYLGHVSERMTEHAGR